MQPARKLFRRNNGGSLAGQDKESRLKRIFRVVMIAEKSAANTHHYRAMPPYQGFESSFVPIAKEPGQELSIRLAGPIGEERNPAKVFHDPVHWASRHWLPSL